ncbi:hypothetical protein HPB51_017491 [Rhipicephalus microplus]|uniref:Uncharacterized protein n=1 Tax=Rhipicephalus microplus TaxID=6941 RepID=A0A9J6F532_RHIMP|nr:hypothetical protein HPB51_017491 [Rhipicephalus microplus]
MPKLGQKHRVLNIEKLDIVDEACKTLLAEVLERQGVTEGISFPDFRDADSDVQTSPDMSDEAIVASVVEVSPNDNDEDDMESNNTGDPGPTVAEVAHCISEMRVFAEKRGLAEKLAHCISFTCVPSAVVSAIVVVVHGKHRDQAASAEISRLPATSTTRFLSPSAFVDTHDPLRIALVNHVICAYGQF